MHDLNISMSRSFSRKKSQFKQKSDPHEKDPLVLKRREEFKRSYVQNWNDKQKFKTGFTENNDPEYPQKI